MDGKNIKEFNLSWWRKQIGLVGQEPVLFSGTIAGNVFVTIKKIYQVEKKK